MITLVRTNSENADFVMLVKYLDEDLAVRDGDEHAFYSQFNKIVSIRHAVVAYDNSAPVGCGALKAFSPDAMEVKRMFVLPQERKLGVATKVLGELEKWARELHYKRCILETGKKQPEAIALYEKNGYYLIANYGQYQGVENSLCFEKML